MQQKPDQGLLLISWHELATNPITQNPRRSPPPSRQAQRDSACTSMDGSPALAEIKYLLENTWGAAGRGWEEEGEEEQPQRPRLQGSKARRGEGEVCRSNWPRKEAEIQRCTEDVGSTLGKAANKVSRVPRDWRLSQSTLYPGCEARLWGILPSWF